MGVHLRTNQFIYEVGSKDFLISFFDTIEIRLARSWFGKKYPTILNEFYNGKLTVKNLEKAEKELKDIRERLKKFEPSKVVWDKTDLSKQPPWGDDISSDITDLSNYFVTSDGEDLFEVIFEAIGKAKEENSELIIE